jgi:hypothetical protein
MEIKKLLESLDELMNEATKETPTGKVHKAEPGGYGRKFDTDEEGDEKKDQKKKAEPAEKRGRGRPPKAGGEADKKSKDIDTATKSLQSFMVGNLPKGKLPGKATTKHTLKDWIEVVKENQNISVEPLRQQSSVVKKNGEVIAQVDDQNLARQIQQGLSSGKISLPGDQNVSEEKHKGLMWRVVQSKATGRYFVVKGYTDTKVWTNERGAGDFIKREDAEAKADELNKNVKEDTSLTGMSEGSLKEFAPSSGSGGDGGEGGGGRKSPNFAYNDGFAKGFGLSDHVTLERAIAINSWSGEHIPHFISGFIQGRTNLIAMDKKQYGIVGKLMKDGSIKRVEQGMSEGADVEYIVVIRDEQGKRSIRISALTPTDAKEKAEAQGHKVLKVKDPNEANYFKEQKDKSENNELWNKILRLMDVYIDQGYSIKGAASKLADRFYQELNWAEPLQAEMNIVSKYKNK